MLTKITLEVIMEFLKIILKTGKTIKFFKRDKLGESSQKKTEMGEHRSRADRPVLLCVSPHPLDKAGELNTQKRKLHSWDRMHLS